MGCWPPCDAATAAAARGGVAVGKPFCCRLPEAAGQGGNSDIEVACAPSKLGQKLRGGVLTMSLAPPSGLSVCA